VDPKGVVVEEGAPNGELVVVPNVEFVVPKGEGFVVPVVPKGVVFEVPNEGVVEVPPNTEEVVVEGAPNPNPVVEGLLVVVPKAVVVEGVDPNKPVLGVVLPNVVLKAGPVLIPYCPCPPVFFA